MSLRDVDRAMIVFKFFYDKSKVIGEEIHKLAIKNKRSFLQVCSLSFNYNPKIICISFFHVQCDITSAVLLALAVCYYARLQEPRKRNDFVVKISAEFKWPLHSISSHMFVEHVQW